MSGIKRFWCWIFPSSRRDNPTRGRAETNQESTETSRQVLVQQAATSYTDSFSATASSPERVTHNDEATMSPHTGQRQYEAADRLGGDASRIFDVASHAWRATDGTVNLLDSVASALKTFARVADVIGEIHPYLRLATALISGISKPIINQDSRDTAFEEMLQEMLRTYDLAQDELRLNDPATRTPVSYEYKLLVEICRVSKECAHFISHEYIDKKFWSRAVKNSLRGTGVDAQIVQFKAQFANLRERWRDAKLKYLDANAVLNRLHFARGAGPTSDKVCLPGTRTAILRSLTEWIVCPQTARVRFLLGVAGSGKSTVAHTVAVQMRARGVLGAFFSFDRNATDRVPQRLLSTIAYELALWNERYRDALVYQLKEYPKLAISTDIAEQWEYLIIAPAKEVASSDPVLLVIDAFDECPTSDGDRSRLRLLELFTGQTAEQLPANFRVLVTSRAEGEIIAATQPTQRLDIGGVFAGNDILCYVRDRLLGLDKGALSDYECEELARAADGLFQWAATTCTFLTERLSGTSIRKKYRAYRDRLTPSLDHLYLTVLEATFDWTDGDVMRNFRIALSLVFCAAEPLSLATLGAIQSLVDDSQVEVVAAILGSMGVVLEGTSDCSTPIRPMHASFRDFLLDSSRSGCWCLCPADIAAGHRVLGLGTLRILDRDLPVMRRPSSIGPEDIGDWLSDLPTGLHYSAMKWDYHICCTQDETTIGRADDLRSTAQRILSDNHQSWRELHTALSQYDYFRLDLDLKKRTLPVAPRLRGRHCGDANRWKSAGDPDGRRLETSCVPERIHQELLSLPR